MDIWIIDGAISALFILIQGSFALQQPFNTMVGVHTILYYSDMHGSMCDCVSCHRTEAVYGLVYRCPRI